MAAGRGRRPGLRCRATGRGRRPSLMWCRAAGRGRAHGLIPSKDCGQGSDAGSRCGQEGGGWSGVGRVRHGWCTPHTTTTNNLHKKSGGEIALSEKIALEYVEMIRDEGRQIETEMGLR